MHRADLSFVPLLADEYDKLSQGLEIQIPIPGEHTLNQGDTIGWMYHDIYGSARVIRKAPVHSNGVDFEAYYIKNNLK